MTLPEIAPVWLAIGAVATLSAAWIARPLVTRGSIETAEGERSISFYRDQLAELARAEASGLLTPAAKAEAEREIELRAARAARRFGGDLAVARPSPGLGLLVAGVLAALTLGLYGLLGVPGMPDQPIAERRTAALEARAEAGDTAARAALALVALKDTPDGLEKFWAMGQAFTQLGDHARASEAYRQAAEASNDDPAVLSAYAEALILANGNKVPPLARIVIGQILAKTPFDPRARYYNALADAQAQNFGAALDGWLELYRDSPPTSPWGPQVRRDIVNMARFTGRDLASVLPDATEAERALAATPMGPAPAPKGAPESVAESVGALRARLAANPKDWQAAIALADRLSNDRAEARAVLDRTAEAFDGAPFVLAEIAAARRRVAAPRNPDAEEVAAAAEMSPDARAEMIDAMVAGLSSRLAANPDDIEGWLMLLRSYAVLQKPEEARAALARAEDAFVEGSAEAREIARAAAQLGLR